jgi:hypothetical protein
MPAVPAIIGVVGSIAAAKIASNSNKHAIDVSAKGTTDALDYEKQKAADYRTRYDAWAASEKQRQSAYYKHFYGFDPNEGSTPAGATGAPATPTKTAPITTGGTYAPGFGPTTSPPTGMPPAPQGQPGVMPGPPSAPPAVTGPGGATAQDLYLQQPRGQSIGAMIGGPASAPPPFPPGV